MFYSDIKANSTTVEIRTNELKPSTLYVRNMETTHRGRGVLFEELSLIETFPKILIARYVFFIQNHRYANSLTRVLLEIRETPHLTNLFNG